ncbi:tyrosine-type recombinase/integrase [Streptomyces sp. NRRL S-515]|uniref:tyrosine-type recombinase/integrase n=1 Tax=Streptomyces sp. NRRL S-515 TaxID=1463913 RepID=UPI0022773133|nr:site-specific integrase [Streptomyces sp. NRRL S-515]
MGRFGKLHVRHGKGARGSGPRERMVPLINGVGRTLRWFIEDVRGQFDDDHTRPGAPLFPSERKNTDGSSRRAGDDALRDGLKNAAEAHLPGCGKKLTPHVLRHFYASRPYANGLDRLAIQEVLGHSWIATTMRSVHVQQTRVEDAWVTGMERAAKPLEGLVR